MMTRARSALVCVTTCQRPAYVRRHLPHFACLCAQDARFALLVSLDGGDPETRQLCERWQVPLIHSDVREGVGMSKNRVLELFPDFEYYFFIEDDVELVDAAVFRTHLDLAGASRIHHFSLFMRGGARRVVGESVAAGYHVVHAMFGGGVFNFFTGEGLRLVGGWHPIFAQYRRWGHTEHSYRFWRAGLAPAPFNVATELADCCIWHGPPAVTQTGDMTFDMDEIARPERKLMEQELRHFPVQTGSDYHFNGMPFSSLGQLAETLRPDERYPLAKGRERRLARSEYHFWKAEAATSGSQRALGLARALYYWPSNPSIRHAVKTRYGG